MKKFTIATALVLSLAVVWGVAFAAECSVTVAWFVNDANGLQASDFDSWVTLKNTAAYDTTLYLDYYDDGDYSVVATTDTLEMITQAGKAYYTGTAARDYGMGDLAERGTLNVRWSDCAATADSATDMLGYVTVINWNAGYAFATNFQ